MIPVPHGFDGFGGRTVEGPDACAENGAGALQGTVFCALSTTGPDPTQDELVRIRAWRLHPRADSEATFERIANPFRERSALEAALPRLERELGIGRADLEAAPAPAEAFAELELFLRGDPLVVPEIDVFDAWSRHCCGRGASASTIGLVEVAALLLPGRLALRRAQLVQALTGAASTERGDLGPLELHAAFVELVRRFLDQEDDVVRVALTGYARAARGLRATAPDAAERLERLCTWLDRPAERAAFEGNRFEGRRGAETPIEDLLETLRPRCAREWARWAELESLPPERDEPLPFADEDRARLEEIFRVHLPAQFGACYRAGQHEVAQRVAATLGSHELLLVHAPTGTGKTLAYLVPALLWARRHGVRVGVATYTRALQEQALDREVPRALAALAQAGVPAHAAPERGVPNGTRVTLLKGRENYLCWRALKAVLPAEQEDGEAWLAWTVLALFALSDVDGDLDRLPLAPPLALGASAPYLQVFTALVRAVRAQIACCTHRDDRECCAAEVARRRAERSHLVLINHAFALARPEFFRHVVFDECEHLHEQAHNAWSYTLSFRLVRAMLARLAQPERAGSRAVFERLARLLLDSGPSSASLERAQAAWHATSEALAGLESAVDRFLVWREEALRGRSERDGYRLLAEYSARDEGLDLAAWRGELAIAGSELESAIAEVCERLDALPVRGVAGLRRALDLARTDVQEILTALAACLPLEEGQPAFRPQTFYDAERDARGDAQLVARVLLPNEFLGRGYYPQLSSAVFLSATTWLQESFDCARGYLGLDRAAQPAEDEERPPCVVRDFRAPDVFDYARVLVAVPRDAPPASGDKGEFLDYVRRFVGHLGERTRGRMLVLFTNAQDAKRTGAELAGFFRARSIGLWFQNMEGSVKEELSELFRARVDSVLLGVDTFWYGADFPGETLEYLVIVRLPYGVPDRYHHAQCAALGTVEQRRRIYLPRALAKFRQGFGRLMRCESDKGCVFLLDGRVLEPNHRMFLRELPIENALEAMHRGDGELGRARFLRADTDRCVRAALEHMGITEAVRSRGLDWSFAAPGRTSSDSADATVRAGGGWNRSRSGQASAVRPADGVFDIAPEDVPF